ncbi:MAG TPA: hypothetical protein VNI36_08140 [Candidatus Dormibacteraeota bacterium]|nr:hypothetical protein [Candidatus Dormibacteraeota bacterium]
MKIRFIVTAASCGIFGVACIVFPNLLLAQAPAGPLPRPESRGIPIPPPRNEPKQKPPARRTTIGGAWKLNHDESDDPRRKIRDLKNTNGRNSGGYPGGGGRVGIGFPFPGAGGPMGGGIPQGRGGERERDNLKLLDAVQPATSLSIVLKTGEVDVTEDDSRKLVFYTDGRQIQTSKDAADRELSAHWDGDRLVSEEKSPEKGKLIRTFQLSPDGRQFYVTLSVGTNKSKTPVVLQYVYDIYIPPTHQTDPYQPVMRRRAEENKSSTQSPPAQSSAPPSATPDPDQPVMKRRTDENN